MIRISCCIPGGSFMPQGEGAIPLSPLKTLMQGMHMVQTLGYDCAEATVGMIMALSEDDVLTLKGEFDMGNVTSSSPSPADPAKRFRLEACNSFIPNHLPMITDEAGTKALYTYAEQAIARMAKLGVRYVVFGSGKMRTIPQGVDRAEAEKQLDRFLIHCNACCETYGMTLVVEPLNKKETNWCNTVAEGAAVVRRLQLPHVRLLADGYHMAQEGEAVSVLRENSDILLHCHIASTDRHIPGTTSYEGDFIDTLCAMQYDGIVTVECGFKDFEKEAAAAAEYLRKRIAANA